MFGKQNGFTNIPLRRRIEALALTLVTVLASASVDWSSLTARAEEGGDTLNGTVHTITSTDNQIIWTYKGTKGGLDEKPYDAIQSAYIMLNVSGGTADFRVDVCQNYTGEDYFGEENGDTSVVNNGKGTDRPIVDVTGYQNNDFYGVKLWNRANPADSPIIVSQGETAAIIITFSNISSGATVQYKTGTDDENKEFAVETKKACLKDFKNAVLQGSDTPIVMTTDPADGGVYNFSDRFSLNPHYASENAIDYQVKDENGTESATVVSLNKYEKTLTSVATGSAILVVTAPGADPVNIKVKNIDKGSPTTKKVYDGKSIDGVQPKCGTYDLKEDQDFTVSYSGYKKDQVKNVGTYTANVVGMSGTDYAGLSYQQDFTITEKNLDDGKGNWNTGLSLTEANLIIDPATLTVSPNTTNEPLKDTVDGNQVDLVYGRDYTATVKRVASDSGDKSFEVTFTGQGNYAGTHVVTTTNASLTTGFHDLSSMIGGISYTNSSFTFDATAKKPTFTLQDKNGVKLNLADKTDYTYTIVNIKNPGVVVYDSAATDKDSSKGVTEAGTYKILVTGKPDTANQTGYTGTWDSSTVDGGTFTVAPAELGPQSIVVKLSPNIFYYTGNDDEQHPTSAEVYFPYKTSDTDTSLSGKWSMTEGTDYTIEYETYKKGVSRYTATITAVEGGNFTGSLYFLNFKDDEINPLSRPFFEIKDSLDTATVSLKYNGATVTTEKTADWERTAAADAFKPVYNGAAIKPDVTVTLGGKALVADKDYTAIYDENKSTKAGEASLIIRGQNDYAGQNHDMVVKFTIAPQSLTANMLKVSAGEKIYAMGQPITLAYDKSEFYLLKDGSDSKSAHLVFADATESELASGADAIAAKYQNADYYVTYSDNEDAGDAKIIAHGINNYTGDITETFKINPKEMKSKDDGGMFRVDTLPEKSYTGSKITQDDKDITVRYGNSILKNGTDYDVEYDNNLQVSTDASPAKMIVKGKKNFSGEITATFKIVAKSLDDGSVEYYIGSGPWKKLGPENPTTLQPGYTGKAYEPGITLRSGSVTLKYDKDYLIEYSNDYSVGEHEIKITGKEGGPYTGSSTTLTYRVIPGDLGTIDALKVQTATKADATETTTAADGTTTTTIKPGYLVTGADGVLRYYQVVNGSTTFPESVTSGSTPKKNFRYTWTKSDGTTTENAAPTKAGDDYTLTLTGAGNYKGTKTFTTDANGGKFMVGASLDVNGIVDLAEKEGTDVPFLGTNMPVVTVDPTALTKTASTGAESGDVNKYNTNVVFEDDKGNTVTSPTMTGPSYTSGKYVNGKTGQDYTIEYVDDAGNVLTSLPVGTSFKVRISAVEGSTRFFGSHTILNSRTIKANTLSNLAARSKVTVSDPKSTTSYVKDPADSSNDTKLSYSYTGSSITPSLTVRIEPQATDKETGFKGTFAPIDLANYGFTYATDNTDTAVLPSNVTSGSHNIQVTGTGASITGTTNVPYEITAREITSDMVSLQTPTKASYNGKSHKDEIIPVVKDGSNVLKAGTDYVVEYYSGTSWGDAQPINNDEKYKTVGKIFVKIVNLTTSQNYKVASDGIKIDTPFEIEGKDIADLTVSLDNSYKTEGESYYSKQYTGSELKPKVSVKDGATDLAENTDFTVAYSENTDIGTATVTVSGTGNYSGTKTLHFYIYGQLTDSAASPGFFVATDIDTADATYVLNDKGKPAKTDGTVLDYRTVAFQDSGKAFTIKGAQYYSITVKKIVNGSTYSATDIAGPAKYQITYKGNGKEKGLTGDATYTITVQGDLATATISGYRDNYDHVYDYAGPNETPGPKDKSGLTVMLSGGYVLGSAEYTLIPNADKHSPNDGEASFTIKPSDSYSAYYTSNGDRQVPFKIRYNLSTLTVTASDTNAPVIGDDLQKIIDNNEIKVTSAGIELTVNTDYTITNAVWQTIPTNGVAKLRVTLAPDNGGTKSYNTKTYTVNGQTKDWSQINISQEGEKEKTYDGEDVFSTINDSISVTDEDGNTLEKGQDYSITWKEGTEKTGKTVTSIKDAGTYTAWIKGINKYFTQDFVAGITNPTYKIDPKSLDGNATMELVDENVKYYSGSDPNAKFTVTDSTLGVLTEGKDYTIERTSPAAGETTWATGTSVAYKVTGIGNYKDNLTEGGSFTIEAADLSKEGVVTIKKDSEEYDGKAHTPEFEVYRGETKLIPDTDYTVTAVDPDAELVNVGSHDYKIEGKTGSNYTGSKTITFKITPRDLTKATISLDSTTYSWANGQGVEPTYTVADTNDAGTTIIDSTRDLTITYANNKDSYQLVDDDTTDAKAPAVVFTAKADGNYTGTVTKHFQIGTSIADAKVTLTKPASFEYDGEAHTPTIASISAGSASYAGSDIAKVATITYKDADGNAVTDPTEVGTYTVVVTGTGPFFGTNEKATFEITSKNIKTREITVNILEDDAQHKDGDDVYYYYTGEEIKPGVEVIYQPTGGTEQTLSPDTDYDVAYKYNKDASDNAQIIVTMKGNYKGSYKTYFSIRSIDISSFKVTLDEKVMDFTGDALTPGFTISGKNAAGEDFERSSVDTDLEAEGLEADWSANIAPGTASLIVTGTGNYTGSTAAASMTIVGELDENTVKANDVFRTGSAITPDITVDFVDSEGESHVMPASWYTVSKVSPVGGSWAKATEYTALVKPTKEGKSFLVPATGYRVTGKLTDEIRGLKIDGYNATYQYTGAKIQPSTLKVVSTTGASLPTGATVTFTETGLNGGDCIRPNTTVQITAKVSYKNADGTTTSVDVENGKYSTEDNKKPATFNIVKRPIKACTFQGPSDTRYTGSALSPIFSIHTEAAQLRNGTDYTYTIRNNVRPGTATVTISGIGNYIGTTTRTFNIYVASPTQLSVSSRSGSNATIRWKAVAHADGYRVTYISASGVRKYTTTNTSMSLTNLKTSGSTQVTVEAYVANGAGNPAWYSNPAAVYIR